MEINEILRVFGLECPIEQMESPKELPIYMVQGRKFFHAKFAEIDFCLVGSNGEEPFGIDSFAKQLERFETALRMPIAFLFENASSAQQKAFFAHRIPFVAAPATVFLPFLGIAMKRKRRVDCAFDLHVEKLTPQAQLLFLYMLYEVKERAVIQADVVKSLGINAMSVSRSARELAACGLLNVSKVGCSTRMENALLGHELVLKALPFLQSPVRKNMLVRRELLPNVLPKAGEVALSLRTMLGTPDKETFACLKKKLPADVVDLSKDFRWLASGGLANVQVWMYNPAIFARDNCVDPLSLYLSMKNSLDERIQGALEEIMENTEW